MKILIYTQEQLEKIVAEGSSGFASPSQWISTMLNSFAETVKRRPASYRSFGPFWWPIKSMMIKAGVIAGQVPDADIVAQATTGSAATDVAAAWAFAEQANENMTASENTFIIDTDDGDTTNYLLVDEEMEAMSSM